MEPGAKGMTAPDVSSRRIPGGFSLVELLVVIAILGIVLALGVPAVGQLMRASGMTNAGDQLLAALSLARQNALSRNRTVEVRFYKYTDAADPQGGRFHAVQSFALEPGTNGIATNAISRKITLPPTSYISTAPSLSSLLDPATCPRSTGAALGQPLSPCGLNYEAAIFRIYPDGSTSITNSQPVFVTVVPANIPDEAATPPPNYATVILQPTTGKVQLHRR
jgi:uncharacterized protein (TIGR02596 family)